MTVIIASNVPADSNGSHANPDDGWASLLMSSSGEFTIAWGEDTNCAGCGWFLAAGSPAWPDDDNRPLCCECAATGGAA
jgi:hypothetical protein